MYYRIYAGSEHPHLNMVANNTYLAKCNPLSVYEANQLNILISECMECFQKSNVGFVTFEIVCMHNFTKIVICNWVAIA